MTECNGTCCEMLMLSYTPEQLADAAHNDAESAQIAAMCISVGPGEGPEGAGWLYACRNWNPETRQCQIYDRRPMMCRDYPYNHEPCPHCGLVQ